MAGLIDDFFPVAVRSDESGSEQPLSRKPGGGPLRLFARLIVWPFPVILAGAGIFAASRGMDAALAALAGGLTVQGVVLAAMLWRWRDPGGTDVPGPADQNPLAEALLAHDGKPVMVTTLRGRFVTASAPYMTLAGETASLRPFLARSEDRRLLAGVLTQIRRTGSGCARLDLRFPGDEAPAAYRVRATCAGDRSGDTPGDLVVWTVDGDTRAPADGAADGAGDTPPADNALAGHVAPLETWVGRLLQTLECGLVIEDKAGRPRYMNRVMRGWLDGPADGDADDMPLLSAVGARDEKVLTAVLRPQDGTLHLPDGRRLDMTVFDIAGPEAEGVSPGRCILCGEFSPAQAGARETADDTRLAGPVFDAAPIAVAIVERDGSLIEQNRLFSDLLRETGADRDGNVLSILPQEDRNELAGLIRDIYGGAMPGRLLEVTLHGERERLGRIYSSSLTHGPRRAAVLYFIDTTTEKSLERQFSQAQKMQAIGQLAGGVAHDFNNLLTAILGFCDLLLLRHDPSDRSFSDLMQIKQNANRAANLVRQLLAFSRQQTLRPKVLIVTDVLAELSNLLRRLIGEKIDFRVHHGRNLKSVKVDQGQLEQVIINLAVNARDAMPDGGSLEIRTRMVEEGDVLIDTHDVIETQSYVLIEVEDTGTGIPQENINKIFEPFFTTKEVGQGTGLGLATVYGIVKQTGGYIFAESSVGEGTVFRLFLPVHGEDSEDVRVEVKPEAVRDLTGAGIILLVEDEDPVRMFARQALSNKGYTVLDADSGEAALRLLDDHDGPVDLMISDVVMPQMDGPALVQAVRRKYPDIPVILVSGYAEDVLRKDLEAGKYEFLSKPFSLSDLAEKVKSLIR